MKKRFIVSVCLVLLVLPLQAKAEEPLHSIPAGGAATATEAGSPGSVVYAPDNADPTVRDQAVTPAGLAAAMAKNPGAIVGEIRLLPFRKDELPDGWHYPSGDYFELTSPVGMALDSLPTSFKEDWGITVSGSAIRLCDPEKFFAVDGGGATVGRLFRAVNGIDRQPGSTEDDAIRNITGYMHVGDGISSGYWYGAFTHWDYAYGYQTGSNPGYSYRGIKLDASLAVPTADENRPFNVGMTPAIYLGH